MTRSVPGPVFHGDAFQAGRIPLRVIEDLRVFEDIVSICFGHLTAREGRSIKSRKLALSLAELRPGSSHPHYALDDSDSALFELPPIVVEAVSLGRSYVGLAAGQRFAEVPDDVLRCTLRFGTGRGAGEFITESGDPSAPHFDATTAKAIERYLSRPLQLREAQALAVVTGVWEERGGRKASLALLDGRQATVPLYLPGVSRVVGAAFNGDPTAPKVTVRTRLVEEWRDGSFRRIAEIHEATALEGPDIVAAFRELRHVPDDWDGEGGRPPTAAAIAQALQFVAHLLHDPSCTRTPYVLPGHDGEVWAEWLVPPGAARRVASRFRGVAQATTTASGAPEVLSTADPDAYRSAVLRHIMAIE